MPELRRDPIIGRWVIISTERAKRPDQFKASNVDLDAPVRTEKCPFCEGNEDLTHPEIYALRKRFSAPNGPGWEVRVIPSISPLLETGTSLDRHGHGMYDLMNARGTHEVVVQSPKHLQESELTQDETVKSINVVLDRMRELEKDDNIKYVLLFKNYGEAAGGGRFNHARFQLIGTPVNLKRVKEELVGTKKYFDYKERCIFCDILSQEAVSRKRVIMETKNFTAITPFASRFPFETWVLPKSHSCDFYKMDKSLVPELVTIMHSAFARIRKVIGEFPYNVVLHAAPFRRDTKKRGYWETIDSDYHWHFEILPILTRVAGFEWGSGFYINPLPPEDACKALKEVVL